TPSGASFATRVSGRSTSRAERQYRWADGGNVALAQAVVAGKRCRLRVHKTSRSAGTCIPAGYGHCRRPRSSGGHPRSAAYEQPVAAPGTGRGGLRGQPQQGVPMTAHYTFFRSTALLSAIVTLAIGISLIVAPSKARAETAKVSFRDVAAEVQNGNQIVITAEVTVPGTAGKPRTGSVVFSAYMEYGEDGTFMDYTDDM